MDRDVKDRLKAGGSSMSQSGRNMIESSREEAASSIRPVQFKRGGKVRKTGIVRVHKGERVIPAGKRKKVERMMKRAGMRMKARR